MCPQKIVAISLVFLVCFINHATAQQTKQVAFTGKVVDDLGQPIAGAKVTTYEMHFDGIAGNFMLHQVGEVTTAEDGAFTFTTDPKPEKSLFYQCYIVAAKQDLALDWTIWKMREDVVSNIELGKPEKLEGVIVDEAGKPIVGAEVRANLNRIKKTTEGEEKNEWLGGIAPLDELGTYTNSQGRFFFSNLPADLCVDLLVMAAGKATTYTYQWALKKSAFKAGQTDIRVVLPAEARIEGKIVDPDTGKGIPGLKFAVVYTGSGVFFYRFVCTTDDNGAFSIGGLLSSEYLIRGHGRNSLQPTYVNAKSGQTKKVAVGVNKLYYGRILFEDGSPVVVNPEPWPGARTRIRVMGEGEIRNIINGEFDDEGYFEIYLSQEQYQQFQSGKAWFMVTTPYTDRRAYLAEDVFAQDLLATNKANAGVARIRGPEKKPNWLIGKTLPELKPFNIDLSQTSMQSKIVLVCFFDMNQRPSRNCIEKLAKQADELKRKGATIIAIQASKVDKDKLDQWVRKQGISFPVGMIQGDEEKTHIAWGGVRSLPWLILTDRKHIVRAAGFSINELDEKITTLREK